MATDPNAPFKMRLMNKVYAKAQAQKKAMDPATQLAEYNAAAPGAIRAAYAPAYGDISAQFNPAMTQARASLAENPAAARSGGVGNAINRRLLTGAYGALGRAQAGAAGQGAMGGLDLLGDLIRRRYQSRLEEEAAKRAKKGGGIGGAIGGIVGGIGGSILGPVGAAFGQKIGSKLNPNATYGQ